MGREKINTIKKFGVSDNVVYLFVLIALVLFFAPWFPGLTVGQTKLPAFDPTTTITLRMMGCISGIALLLLLYWPLWPNYQPDGSVTQATGIPPLENSKYIIQSTPDIIMNELNAHHIHTGGFKIVSGITVHDVEKRLKILNPTVSESSINQFVKAARERAFTMKYSAPKEDEKLEDIRSLPIANLKPWNSYLDSFLMRLGFSDITDISVLDVGIGNAYASHAFLKQCKNLTGADISRDALNFAKQKLPEARLIVASAEALQEVPSISVDLYISLRTYQSTLFDVKESLHEAYRVIRIGGVIVVSIPFLYTFKSNGENVVQYGLLQPGAKTPSAEYAYAVANAIADNMAALGFSNVEIGKESPFEIFIGAIKRSQ